LKYVCMAFATALLSLASSTALAVLQDEIQVYTGDINAPGEFGLDTHLNTTPVSNVGPSYPGEVTDRHGLRINPEFSYGMTKTLEAGFYLPFVMDSRGSISSAGEKMRVKWLPIQASKPTDWYAGTNIEVSRLAFEYEQARHLVEMRNIVGFQTPDWSGAANPIFRTGLTEGYRRPPEFELDLRLMRRLDAQYQVGIEYYHVFGPVNAVNSLDTEARQVLAVLETDLPRHWKLHLGVGHGWGTADNLTLMSIVTVPLN